MLAVPIPFSLNNDTTETSLDPLIAVITRCTTAAPEVSPVQCKWGMRGWESTCQSYPSYSSPGGVSQSWEQLIPLGEETLLVCSRAQREASL